METYSRLILCALLLSAVVLAAPPNRKSSYSKPTHHDHHRDLNHQQDEGAWFNGQVTEPPLEWPQEADEPDVADADGDADDEQPKLKQQQQQQQQQQHKQHKQQHKHNHHHHHYQNDHEQEQEQQQQQQQQQQEERDEAAQDREGSTGPWVGLTDTAVGNDKKRAPRPSTYGGKKNDAIGNGRSKTTTTAPAWPPKSVVPQTRWTDPAHSDDSLWPDTPESPAHRKFHGRTTKQKGTNEASSSPQGPSWSHTPSKGTAWPSKSNNNEDLHIIEGNGTKNGNGHHDPSASSKPDAISWDQVPSGYAHKRPTWREKKDHVIKFKESKFSQTDFTAPSDEARNGDWTEEDEEEAEWPEEEPNVSPKKSNGAATHHSSLKQKQNPIQTNGSARSKSWSDGIAQSWPRGTPSKHAKWTAANDGKGSHTEAASPGDHHHHHDSSTSSLSNGWLDLQKELYLLKNKVRVSSSNGAWLPTTRVGSNSWKQPWAQDQEPFTSATKMVTKVVFGESLPKGEKMIMRWSPPVSYQPGKLHQ